MDAGDWSWSDIGARVAEARKARGLSQERMADSMGLDRTAIAKIESGRRQINSLELVKLGELLDRPLSWFVSPLPSVVTSRRAARSEQRVDKAGEYALEDALRDLQTLIDARTIRAREPIAALPAFDAKDQDAVLDAAARTRQLLGVDPAAPLHLLADLAERVGLYTWAAPLGENALDGAYTAHGSLASTGVAVVNSTLDAGRRRSTLAHELGHHVLGDAYSSDWGVISNEREQAIDAFAAALLCPPGAADRWRPLRQAQGLRQSVILLAADYRVSWSTALRQLRAYDLLSAEERRKLEQSSPTRADYLECAVRVFEELQGVQVPSGIKAAAVRAFRTYKISPSRALEIIGDPSLSQEDLGQPDSVPVESLWGEIGSGLE